ncbi:MAG: response regulator [Burkholderiales bacterium]|nr:response regulator [Burkholderiales bacterium]
MKPDSKPTILVVDDTPANLTLLNSLLRDSYRVKLANSGAKALQLASSEAPDLILLDIVMPEMDGYQVCQHLKAQAATQRVPVIFLTSKSAPEDEEEGLKMGAVDFIHKPISLPIVLARIKTHLQMKAWQDFLQDQNAWLQKQVEQRLSEINHLQDATIHVMVSLAEFRDEFASRHIAHIQEYVRLLARELATLPRYSSQLSESDIMMLSKLAALHDVGKIAIADHILLKPSALTAEEFAIIQTHAQRGYEILCQAGEQMGQQGAFLATAKQMALSHHERWDGSGYPAGLSGTAIPLAARLMALADVYDALCTQRPNRAAFSHEQATSMILEGRGTHFDPDIVDCFANISSHFAAVAQRLAVQ